jgi:sugar O-acyltransferase (sialic acid O-acetyltransferase NeuD family)
MKPINIVIAGLEKDVLSLAMSQAESYTILGYTDKVDRKIKIPYLGNDEDFIASSQLACGVILPIDSPEVRKNLEKIYRSSNFYFPNLISKNAVLDSFDTSNSEGLIIQAGTYLSSDVRLGNFVKLNVGAKVFHDSLVGDFSTLAPGATVLGSCVLGRECYLGANSILRNGVSIEAGITIGFGSVVTKSLTKSNGTVYLGNPAKPHKRRENE